MHLVKDKKFIQANFFLIVSLIIFFYQPIFTNQIQVPSDILQTYPFFRVDNLPAYPANEAMFDVVFSLIPGLHFNIASLKQGHLPLWYPDIGCGAPAIADMQVAFFYPLNIFPYLFGLKWGLFFLYFFKLYFAGIFMYLYERKIGIKHEAAVIGSCAFMYAGFNMIFLYWPQINLAFYLPLGMLSTELILDTPEKLRGYLLLSIGSAIAVFGGHPESLFFRASILILYFFIRLFQNRSRVRVKNIITKTTLFVFVAILISAIQWLPFLQYLFLSYTYLQRSFVPNSSYFQPAALFLSIVPDFFSNFFKLQIPFSFGLFLFIGYTGYIGITIFFLFLMESLQLYKNKFTFLFILILVYISIATFNVPILHDLIALLPPFHVSNAGISLFGCSNIFIILIAIIGLNKLFDNDLSFVYVKSALLMALFVMIFLLILYVSYINNIADPSVLKQLYVYTATDMGITLLFLFMTVLVLKIHQVNLQFYLLLILVFSQTALPFIRYEAPTNLAYLYPQNTIMKTLQQQPSPFRAFPISINPAYKPAWPPDITTYYEIEDIRNYDALGVKWYELLFKTMSLPDFLNLANVKYIVLNQNDTAPSISLHLEPVVKDKGFILYNNLSAFDRAFMVYDYKVANNDNEFLELTNNLSAQLHNLAVIMIRDIKYASFKTNLSGINNHSEITFLRYQPTFIKMKVNTSSPGLLVISNTFFPGWKAYVDNQESEIIRTDYAFDGIFLTQGDHTVILEYKPLSFLIGLVLTITGLISLLLASIFLKTKVFSHMKDISS